LKKELPKIKITMRKILFVLGIILSAPLILYSRTPSDTTVIEKTGWLVYYLGHVIWFESHLNEKVKDKYFFTEGKKYQNGLVVNYNGNAKSFKLIAKCYSINSLTNIDTVTGKGEYTFKQEVCIIPVKAKVKIRITEPDQFEFANVSFKKYNSETTIEYWFNTTYFVREVELIRRKDIKMMRKKMKSQ
jgi:hypothetical protein